MTPPLARLLGFAGLLPQLVFALALWAGPEEWRWAALALGWAYAALIFSFLGGLWWGLASAKSAQRQHVPVWLWFAAVAPSLLAFATFAPWVFGQAWPQPSLAVLGIGIAISPLIDRKLNQVRPDWWMNLRIPLSLGLGLATVLLAVA